MSKMKEVAEILGVEIGEEFEITNYQFIYRITKQQIENRTSGAEYWSGTDGEALYSVLTGRSTIIKKPWKPNLREKYYFMCVGGNVCKETWHNSVIDLMNYATGNCFKTKEAAEEHDKAVIARLKKIYDDGKPLIGEWRDKE